MIWKPRLSNRVRWSEKTKAGWLGHVFVNRIDYSKSLFKTFVVCLFIFSAIIFLAELYQLGWNKCMCSFKFIALLTLLKRVTKGIHSCRSFKKNETSDLLSKSEEAVCSFLKSEWAIHFFCHKTSDSHEKPKSKFPTLLLLLSHTVTVCLMIFILHLCIPRTYLLVTMYLSICPPLSVPSPLSLSSIILQSLRRPCGPSVGF